MDDFDKDLEFEWDKGNIDKSWKKHGIEQKESEQAFFDEKAMISLDIKHARLERRWLLLGKTKSKKKLAVIFTKRKLKIRIISAQVMNKKERKTYEKQEIITGS